MNDLNKKKKIKNYILLALALLIFIFFFKKLTIINLPFLKISEFYKYNLENIKFFFETKNIYEKYNQAVNENNSLKQQNSFLLLVKDEIEKNKIIISNASIQHRPFLASKILTIQRTESEQFMILNRGSIDKVEKNDVVVFGNYLIGKIYEIFPFYSKAIFSSDPKSKISVYFEKSNLIGIANGCGDKNTLQVFYLENDPNLKEGSLVYTSGEGLIFPPGLCVGKIEKIIRNGDLYVNLIIKNDLELKNLTTCQIILNKNNPENSKELFSEIFAPISTEKNYAETNEDSNIKTNETEKDFEKENKASHATTITLSEKMKIHANMINKIKNIE
jgi:cell shape-determining protein MreC